MCLRPIRTRAEVIYIHAFVNISIFEPQGSGQKQILNKKNEIERNERKKHPTFSNCWPACARPH